jgi:hypothetical protein
MGVVVRQQSRATAWRPLFVVDVETGTRQPWAEDTSTLYLTEGLR